MSHSRNYRYVLRHRCALRAELLAHLRKTGKAMPNKDSLIAATAIAHGLAVVTRNLIDFAKSGVRVIDRFVR